MTLSSPYSYRVEVRGQDGLVFRRRAMMIASPHCQAHVTVEQLIGQLESLPEGVRFTPFTEDQDPGGPWLFRSGAAAIFSTINAVIEHLITAVA